MSRTSFSPSWRSHAVQREQEFVDGVGTEAGGEDAPQQRACAPAWRYPVVMPCAHPIPAYRPQRWRNGQLEVVEGRLSLMKLDVREFSSPDRALVEFEFLLPCGSCVGCQISRARSWAVRCELELRQHSRASFVTLTYRDDDLPMFETLRRDHLSDFMRSLRKKLKRDKVSLRYFGCGEYGERRGRPHYHAILFATEDVEVIQRSWPHGFATVSQVTPGRIAYTAGYCAKKVGLLDPAREVVDVSTGEVLDEYQPPFLQMSRRPGIAGHVRRHWKSWRTVARWQGREVPAPRFLHKSWADNASELEKAQLLLERAESQMRPTVRELDASKEIAYSRLRINEQRRQL